MDTGRRSTFAISGELKRSAGSCHLHRRWSKALPESSSPIIRRRDSSSSTDNTSSHRTVARFRCRRFFALRSRRRLGNVHSVHLLSISYWAAAPSRFSSSTRRPPRNEASANRSRRGGDSLRRRRATSWSTPDVKPGSGKRGQFRWPQPSTWHRRRLGSLRRRAGAVPRQWPLRHLGVDAVAHSVLTEAGTRALINHAPPADAGRSASGGALSVSAAFSAASAWRGSAYRPWPVRGPDWASRSPGFMRSTRRQASAASRGSQLIFPEPSHLAGQFGTRLRVFSAQNLISST